MSGPSPILDRIAETLEPSGILVRGVANFDPGGGPLLTTGEPARAVVLLGNAGSSLWSAFSRWRESHEDADPLDTWSKTLIRPLAKALGGTAYFPSDPPWQPFQQWAIKAEGLRPSPLGLLIHPRYGLWHGYRGGLGFPFPIESTGHGAEHPCDHCQDKPCLAACPVGAIALSGFDVTQCRGNLESEAGQLGCMTAGCLSRNACPVGASHRYEPAQLRFHMKSLL
jgi:ferredoxin